MARALVLARILFEITRHVLEEFAAGSLESDGHKHGRQRTAPAQRNDRPIRTRSQEPWNSYDGMIGKDIVETPSHKGSLPKVRLWR